MTKSFIIVISIVLIVQIVSICSFLRFCPVAKAGKVSKFYWRYKLLLGKGPKIVDFNGEKIDVSSYKELYVYGNSMKDYHICNGQKVLVSEYRTERQKESIEDFPVLVFHIYDMKFQSSYKLRKFVGYIDSPEETDWGKLYIKYKNRIKVDESQFTSELQKKTMNTDVKQDRYILSETYDEDSCLYHYSIHPVRSLFAKVMYAI